MPLGKPSRRIGAPEVLGNEDMRPQAEATLTGVKPLCEALEMTSCFGLYAGAGRSQAEDKAAVLRNTFLDVRPRASRPARAQSEGVPVRTAADDLSFFRYVQSFHFGHWRSSRHLAALEASLPHILASGWRAAWKGSAEFTLMERREGLDHTPSAPATPRRISQGLRQDPSDASRAAAGAGAAQALVPALPLADLSAASAAAAPPLPPLLAAGSGVSCAKQRREWPQRCVGERRAPTRGAGSEGGTCDAPGAAGALAQRWAEYDAGRVGPADGALRRASRVPDSGRRDWQPTLRHVCKAYALRQSPL